MKSILNEPVMAAYQVKTENTIEKKKEKPMNKICRNPLETKHNISPCFKNSDGNLPDYKRT